MIYIERKDLKIIQTNSNFLKKEYLIDYLKNNFTKKIYVENDNEIVGVIDLQNIINSKKNVKINKIHKIIETNFSYDILKKNYEVVIKKENKRRIL